PKRRISVLSSIIISYLAAILVTAGMNWFLLYKETKTISTVTVLYDRAFEGVDYSHLAYSEFENLMRSHLTEHTSFRDQESKDRLDSIREYLDIAGDHAFGPREKTLIANIEDNLDALIRDTNPTPAISSIDNDSVKLIRRFTADRMDSRDA